MARAHVVIDDSPHKWTYMPDSFMRQKTSSRFFADINRALDVYLED